MHQDLENIDVPFSAASFGEESPQRRLVDAAAIRGETALGTDIAADHQSRRVALHDIHRQVVDGRAIDQDFFAAKHRRHDAGNRDRGAQRLCQPAFAVLPCPAGSEVGADAQVRPAQILDQHVAVLAFEQTRDLASPGQGDQWKGVIIDRVGVDETSAIAQFHLLIAPADRDAGRDDGPYAGAAYEVDGHARNARITPRCAKPRAPPPDSTSPTPRRVSRRATRLKSWASTM